MRNSTATFLTALLIVGGCTNDETTRIDTTTKPINENIDLNELLKKHDSSLGQLRTANVSWSVEYQNEGSDLTREELRTLIAPNFYATTAYSADRKPIHRWWDGEDFGAISGWDPHATSKSDSNSDAVRATRATLYHADLPIHRLFDWRTLRSYRFFANDPDKTIRELCKQSPFEPVITKVDDLIRLKVGHPGQDADPSRGIVGIPSGTPIEIDLDPSQGYLVKRHRTSLDVAEAGGTLVQVLEVSRFEKQNGELYLPVEGKYTASIKGKTMAEQRFRFTFSEVNENVNTAPSKFVPGMLVYEFSQYGENNPLGVYVVSQNRELGPRYADESFARLNQQQQLGYLDEAAFEAKLAALKRAPQVGSKAPNIVARNVESGENQSVSFEGKVTVVEFWSTTCGPCQGSMNSINDLARESSKKWPGKVQVVTISVDDDIEVVRQHLHKRHWSDTLTLIDIPLAEGRETEIGRPYETAHDYVVAAIPTCLVVNSQGTVSYRGHTLDGKVSEKVERLMADEN